MGDYNYYIYKQIEDNTTKTQIKLLTEEETIREIARISEGDITDAGINHAYELIKYAGCFSS